MNYMIINKSDNGTKINFGEQKKWFILYAKNDNDLEIEYFRDEKIYVIKRGDNKPFDGTEDIGGLWAGNMVKPTTLEGMIENKVNALSSVQIEAETSMFKEFDYQISEDRTKIYIYPIYLEETPNVVINVKDELMGDVMVSTGVYQRVRKRIY